MTASSHKKDCPCPVCQLLRSKPDRGDSPQLSVRLAPAVKEAILKAPGGARAYLERLVSEDQDGTGKATSKEVARLKKRLEAVEKTLKSKEKLIEKAESHRNAYRAIQDTLKLREAENRRYQSLIELGRGRIRHLVPVLQRLIHAYEGDFSLELMQLAAQSALTHAAELDTDPPTNAFERRLVGDLD